MSELEFFPVDWIEGDVDEKKPWYRIVAFGKTRDAKSVCVHVRFTPYFFVELPPEWSEARGRLFVTETAREHDGLPGKCMLVKRKSAWGFTNGRAKLMAQLAFETRTAAKRARSALSKRHQTYEASVEPLVRFFHLRDVSPAGWIRATACVPATSPISTSDIEVETTFDRVFPGELVCQPPLVIASWDIETYSESGKFPLPENPGDKIIQISTTFRVYGQSEPYKRTVSCLFATEPVEGAELAWFEHEHEVVNHWISTLRREKTDVLIGYNTHQFDWKYVYGRSLVCVDDATGDELVFLDGLGNLTRGGGKTVERELNSSAYGQNKFFYLSTPGVMQLDLLQWFRKNRSMDSYTLDNVSKTFLGKQKLDLPAAEIFEKFRGTPSDRADIARYAIRDTELPLDLLEKMAIFEDLTEMANAVRVPVDYINNRGQQIRVFSSLVGKARSMGYVIPDDKAISTDGKFEGATVLDAKKGAYFEPIAALDFASLYPSIIRAENMSFDTLVIDPRYANVPGVEYYSVDTGMGTFRFAQPGGDGRFKGVLPCLLDDLAKFRKQAKKDMAAAKARGDAWSATLYNAKQLAYKVTMNSAYGFCGASKGFLPCVPIAASVTATGRNMITRTAQLAAELVPGSEVIYGDSVAAYTPIIIKKPDGLVRIVEIQNMEGEWRKGRDGKEYCETPGVQTWTDEGWTDLHRVIRHEIDKDLVRIVTHTGIVDVTDEHSLLDIDKNVVEPKKCSVGDLMLHANVPEPSVRSDEFSVDEARIMGFFAGDGSCGCYECPSGKKSSFALNNSSADLLQFYKKLCETAYPEYEWVIMETLKSSGVRKLSPRSNDYGGVKRLVQTYRERMYSRSSKIVPVGILNGSREVRQSFWDGFYDADGYRADGKIEISQKNQITCAHLAFLAYSLGHPHVALGDRADKPDVFRLRVHQTIRKDPNAIKVIRRVEPTRYVYDLTTSNHHFAAGIGRLVVHNTDSVMVKFNVAPDLGTQFEVASDVAKRISATFKPPHELEMEKIYHPYVLYSKKRYAAIKYEDPADDGKMDVKGIALVRRDNCPLVKDVLSECLDAMLFKRDATLALDIARQHIRRVLDNEHPMDKFVVSKTLRTGYKVDTQPHVFVARKIQRRRGFPVPSGTRVPYVFVENKDDPNQKQAEKAEDYDHAMKNGLTVDRLYYIDHQLRKPLIGLFEPVSEDPNAEIFDHETIRVKLEALTSARVEDIKIAKRIQKNKTNKQMEITTFFMRRDV